MYGNSSTSRIDGTSARNMTSRSMPTPRPPVGRQAIFERANIVGVEVHRLVVAGILRRNLRAKALGLIFRVVQFGKPVGQFLGVDEQFEAIGNARIGIVRARQRRDLGRMRGDERRLDQRVLDGVLEDRQQQLAPAVTRLDRESSGARNARPVLPRSRNSAR